MFYQVKSVVLLLLLMPLSNQSIAQSMVQNHSSTSTSAQLWTLESSIKQAMLTAPELEKSKTKIGIYEEEMKASGLWPDPSIEFRVDNKLGKDDRSGGYDLTDVTISQAIPLSRLSYQQSAAQASLESAQFLQKYDELAVQTRVAKMFHELQLASSKMALMERRLAFANDLNNNASKKSQGVVVRYLTPLDKMRLNVIREEANQALSNAEGKYNEALIEFTKLLGLNSDSGISVIELEMIYSLAELNTFLAIQDKHPQLLTQQQRLQSANYEIDVARNSQMADPVISLSRSQDSFDSGRDDVYALMFNIQIPLQDRKSSAVSKANYQASEQHIELQRLKRELQLNLKRSHIHANHVIEQASSYKEKVLVPAKKILDLTNKGFISGELNILSLVDATNTYYDAQLRYLDLLYQAHVEVADIRFYAGVVMTDELWQKNAMNKGGL